MIHIYLSADGQYYFTVNSKNGKILTTSETYKQKRAAINGINSLVSAFGAKVQKRNPVLLKKGYKDTHAIWGNGAIIRTFRIKDHTV